MTDKTSSELHTLPRVPAEVIAPSSPVSGFHFQYRPSPTGVDSNLLLLFHGLGDNERNFLQLGERLQREVLPQTAVLSLRGPKGVPLLDEEAFTWWETFTELAEILPSQNQNPAALTRAACGLLDHLIDKLGWLPRNIHLLGFGQGGTAALETCLTWSWQRQKSSSPTEPVLGSVVSIGGPLLSFPTFQPLLSTPVLFHHHKSFPSALSSLRRGFTRVTEMLSAANKAGQAAGGLEDAVMPSFAHDDWFQIAKWWANEAGWRNRSQLELRGELVQVG